MNHILLNSKEQYIYIAVAIETLFGNTSFFSLLIYKNIPLTYKSQSVWLIRG